MLMGLSLCLCVAEIVANRVRIEDVGMILAATRAETQGDWDEVIASYSRSYWRQDPGRAASVVALLRDAGRIQQPRVTGGEHPGVHRGIWQEIPEKTG